MPRLAELGVIVAGLAVSSLVGCQPTCQDLAEQYAYENSKERAVLDACDPTETDACSLMLPVVDWEVPNGATVSDTLTPQQQGFKLVGLGDCLLPRSPSRSSRLQQIYDEFQANGCKLDMVPGCPTMFMCSDTFACGSYNGSHHCMATVGGCWGSVCSALGGTCALDSGQSFPCPSGTSNLACAGGWCDPADCGQSYVCCMPVGGACAYRDIAGTCTITSIAAADPQLANCAIDPVEVTFSFAPTVAPSPPYLYPGRPDTGITLTIDGGENPPLTCVTALGITEGSQHACTRREETAGSCTPVLFDIAGLDFSGCQCL